MRSEPLTPGLNIACPNSPEQGASLLTLIGLHGLGLSVLVLAFRLRCGKLVSRQLLMIVASGLLVPRVALLVLRHGGSSLLGYLRLVAELSRHSRRVVPGAGRHNRARLAVGRPLRRAGPVRRR